MSDSQDKSDDLIAELAKLMASSAGGADQPAQKPGVIKLPPLAEPTVKTAPVRIPGMEPPATPPSAGQAEEAPEAAGPAAPRIRVPGMAKADDAPSAEQSRPAAQFDFGRPPNPGQAFTVPPLSVVSASGERKLPPAPPPRSETVANLAGLKFDPKPAGAAPATTAASPATGASPAPTTTAASPAPTTPSPRPAVRVPPPADAGMPSGGGDEHRQQQAPADRDAARKPPQSEEAVARESAAENDPIADLITAELGRSPPVETPVEEPKAPPPPSEAGPPKRVVPTPTQARNEAEEQAHEAPPAAPPPPVVRTQESSLPNPLQPRSEAQEHRAPPLASFGAKASAAAGEADRFSVMPAAIPDPEPTQPEAELASSLEVAEGGDPMDEIESLIGEAVRVELEGPRPAQKPAPVVPPLGRATPRRADRADMGRADMGRHEPSVDSPEAAILAAAATTGVRVDNVDAPTAEHGKRAKKRAAVKPPKTSGLPSGVRQFAGIGMSAVLLLAAGFGLYWVLGMGGNDDPANAPILSADASPVKVEVTETAETPAPTSVVFDELDGGSGAERDETLVSRDETEGASPTEVASITSPPPVDDQTESGLANRKVRTVTVRPDGTIVTGEATLAGSEALPVERPNVPEIAGADRATSDLLTAAVTENVASPIEALDLGGDVSVALDPEADPIAALVSNTGSATTTALANPEPLDVAAVEDGPQVFDASIVAPIPQPRPANRAALLGSTTSAPAPAATGGGTAPNPPASTPLVAVTQPADAAPPPPAASGAYVQLSSQRTENDARASLRSLESRMSGMLGGRSLDIRQVDLGQRGVWYRVVLPVTTFQDATQTCASLKANGLDCVPING